MQYNCALTQSSFGFDFRFPLDSHICPFYFGSASSDITEQIYIFNASNLFKLNENISIKNSIKYAIGYKRTFVRDIIF